MQALRVLRAGTMVDGLPRATSFGRFFLIFSRSDNSFWLILFQLLVLIHMHAWELVSHSRKLIVKRYGELKVRHMVSIFGGPHTSHVLKDFRAMKLTISM